MGSAVKESRLVTLGLDSAIYSGSQPDEDSRLGASSLHTLYPATA